MKTFKEFLNESMNPTLGVSKFAKIKDSDNKSIIDPNKIKSNHVYKDNPMLLVDWKYHVLAGDLIDAIEVVSKLDNVDLLSVLNKFLRDNKKFNKGDRYKWNPESYNDLLSLIRKEYPAFDKSFKPVKYNVEELMLQKPETTASSGDMDSTIANFFS